MNLNDFFSKPTRIKEAYANNYPSYPAADAADASSDSDSEPKFNRLAKTGKEPELDFRNGLNTDDDETDYETENEPELGTFRMGKPVEPDDADTNAFVAALTPGQQDNRFTAPAGWRYVEKDEDPARYGSGSAAATGAADWGPASIPAAGKSAAASGLPKMRFDQATRSLVPVEEPIALDLSPKNSNIRSGSNPNIDADTRARARAWAAAKNSGVDTVGNIEKRVAAKPTATSADGTAALPTPAAAPAVVKPVVVVPPAAAATTLKDLPTEKPTSWKDIAQANNISNPNLIMPGQVLKIPGRADYTVKPGDTLADIAAGKTKAPKYTPSPGQDPAYVAALEKLKKYPNIGVDAPMPRDMQKALGVGPITTKTYDPFGNEIVKKAGREEILTPVMIQQQKQADADIAAIDAKMRARAAAQAARKKTNETDYDLGYQNNQSPFAHQGTPGANNYEYTMPANAAEREQDLKDFGHLTKNQSLGNPSSIINKNVPNALPGKSPNNPFAIDSGWGAKNYDYTMPANAAERAADLKDFGHVTQNQNLGNPKSFINKNVNAKPATNEVIDRMQSLAGIRKK